MTSASSGRSVSSKPSASRSTSAILSESYSFIWQPNVRIYSLRAMEIGAWKARKYSSYHPGAPRPPTGAIMGPAGVRRAARERGG